MGIILNEIVTRERPYYKLQDEGMPYEEIFTQISERNARVTLSNSDDEHAFRINSLIKDCLQQDPNARPTCGIIRVSF